MALTRTSPPSGLLRRRALGSEALYRVVSTSGPLVEVEVVHAPGLERGMRIRLTMAASRAMEQVPESTITAARFGASVSPQPLFGRLSAR